MFGLIALGEPASYSFRFHVRDADDQALSKRPRRATHRIEGHRSIPGIEKTIQLRSAGAELLGPGLFGFLLPLRLLFQLPGQYSLNGNSLDLFANAFFF